MDFGRFSGRLVCAVFVGGEIYGVLFVCLFVCGGRWVRFAMCCIDVLVGFDDLYQC